VIDAEVGRAPQGRDGRITISRGAEHTWTRQLHRAEADAEHSYRSENMTAWLHAAIVLPKLVSPHRQDLVTTVLAGSGVKSTAARGSGPPRSDSGP
jgi:hypothetical protein